MIISNNYRTYLTRLSSWAGFNVSLMEDFDTICQYDFDFIEILLLCEKEFELDLLEHTASRKDFSTIKDFIDWAQDCSMLQAV